MKTCVFVLAACYVIVIGFATSPRNDLAEKIGHPQFEQLCSKCHTLDRIVNEMY